MPILENINDPCDLKELKLDDLKELAREIRQMIISVISKTGGHLASNLGVVELTIALHRCFDLTKDKIIWDVGHQCYTHKIITGRREQFSSIRQYGGISGFPNIHECKLDCFGTGHASTSISAALGIASARDLKNESFKVLAVIGDGALAGGMAFEALNHAGHTKTDLIVIFNDNEMSISPTVGGLSQCIHRLRTSQIYNFLRSDLVELVTRFGNRARNLAKRIEDSAKTLLTNGMLFESLGFRYFGPIDGHDLSVLIDTFEGIKGIKGPLLIHVLTQKGKGYKLAEENPTEFHSTSSFDIETGKKINIESNISYTKAFGICLNKLAEKDKRIVAITAAMLDGTGVSEFKKLYPERCFDVGIAEEHAVTYAAGLASQGMKPVFAVYSTFLQRSYDQIVHDVCLQNLPVVFVLDRAGIVGADGPTHNGTFDFAYLRHIPNMVVMAPKDEAELHFMLNTAIEYDGPSSIRYPRSQGVGVPLPTDLKTLPIGKAEILKEGDDVLIIAIGSMVYPAIKASEILSENKIFATVINARFVKPLDKDLFLSMIKKIGKVVTVEEHVLSCGFGSAINEMIVRENGRINVQIKNIGIPDIFIQHGSRDELLSDLGLTPDDIARSIIEMLNKNE